MQTCMRLYADVQTMEFFLNEAQLSLNSVNSANSGNLINHRSMNKVHFKDLLCYLCLAGTVVASWLVTQEVEGSDTAFCTNIFQIPQIL